MIMAALYIQQLIHAIAMVHKMQRLALSAGPAIQEEHIDHEADDAIDGKKAVYKKF